MKMSDLADAPLALAAVSLPDTVRVAIAAPAPRKFSSDGIFRAAQSSSRP